MEKWIGDLLVDVSPPEKPKFKSPLILIHDLWSGSWCWRSWATHFCNLGWECWSVNLRGRFEENPFQILKRLNFQECLKDLKQVFHATSFPPVILGHGLGALMAQKTAEEERLSALILVSSIPPAEINVVTPRVLRLLRLKYLPLILLRRPFLLEEKDLRRNWLTSVPESRQPDLLKQMVPESTHLIREFFGCRIRVNRSLIRCPVLAVCGSEDRVVSVASMREVALWLEADFREYSNHGHWMMEEEEGEWIVRDLHRWVIQRLGEKILLVDFSESR